MRSVVFVLERGEAIGLLVILAVMLAATLYLLVRTPSFTVLFAPVEVALAGWVLSDMDGPDDDGGGGTRFGGTPRRGPPGGGGDGGSRVREPRRPRPGSGAGSATRQR